ncbi:MAG: hypothetical protein QOI77_3391, partial [Blastocatellia bacterium]|nr:hypothetical protein [Blastocatellia bacterium]
FRVGKAFRGYPVALRPTQADGVYEIYFATHRILTIDLRQPNYPDQDRFGQPARHLTEP